MYETFLILPSGQVVEVPAWVKLYLDGSLIIDPKEDGIVEGDYTILVRSTLYTHDPTTV